jgi:hypothetical protein
MLLAVREKRIKSLVIPVQHPLVPVFRWYKIKSERERDKPLSLSVEMYISIDMCHDRKENKM